MRPMRLWFSATDGYATERPGRIGGTAVPELDEMRWVGPWTTTPAPVEGMAFANQTLRMIAHVSLGGPRVRVRLSNACGTRKLAIGAAHVALRSAGAGAGIVPESGRPLTFNGAASITIPAG